MMRSTMRLGALATSILISAGGASMTLAAPASAAPASGVVAAANVPCDSPKSPAHSSVVHDGLSESRVEQLDVDVQKRLNAARKASGLSPVRKSRISKRAALRLAPRITIPVYAHVIIGKHKRDRRISKRQVRRAVSTLRNGFRGGQSSQNHVTRFYFKTRKIDFTHNDKWFHANMGSPADRQEKQRLHKAGRRSLNLYFTSGGKQGNVLGWSTFPWQYRGAPRQDNVTVNVNALRGGRLTHFNLGDTVVHESGHWLGLLHTFQGGCQPPGDGVADTPAEQMPSAGCTSYLCNPNDPHANPVHNFMDYATDQCMWMFTAGQTARMDNEFIAYRK